MSRIKAVSTLVAALALMSSGLPALAEDAALTIVFKDGTFTPTRLEVPSQDSVKIILRNEGQMPVEFESLSLRKEKVLGPGVQSFVVLRGPSPGEYNFFDDFHPDAAKGVIVVK
ncbi:MAG: cupredoxin domain-containing protein [Rhodobacteraceae bacterium]|nr:cupredoxin domain-containing protein [Paracoccaceae bacterium]